MSHQYMAPTSKVKKDPTSAIKCNIISKLNELEKLSCIDSKLKHQFNTSSQRLPYFHSPQKNHKDNVPLCPIVGSIASVT